MRIVIDIEDTKVQKLIQSMRTNERGNEEQFIKWRNASFEIDQFIMNCLQKKAEIEKDPHADVDEVREGSDVQNYKVYTDNDNLLYMM
jgi:hypothetical protein